MNKLFDAQYLFSIAPGSPNLLFWKSILIVSAILFMGAIGASFMVRNKRSDALRYRLWFKFAAWGFTASTVFGILAFFRFQQAYVLSMRIWVLLWLAGTLVWLGFILKYLIRDFPKKLLQREELQAFNKYLPRKK